MNCAAITDVPSMTVECAEDEMWLSGMTAGAQDLCVGLTQSQKRHHLQDGVGHYGVFSGSRFRKEVAPRIKDFIQSQLA